MLNIVELTLGPVKPSDLTEDDKTAYIDGFRDMIDLDAPVIVASGNISVSPFFRTSSVINTTVTSCELA